MLKTKSNVFFLSCMSVLLVSSAAFAQKKFNGLDVGLGNVYRTSNAKTRSISLENFTRKKGYYRHQPQTYV